MGEIDMPAKTKRRRRNPEKALHVSTYDRLEAYLQGTRSESPDWPVPPKKK